MMGKGKKALGAIALGTGLFAVSAAALAQEGQLYAGVAFGQSKVDIDTAALGRDLTAAGIGHTGLRADEEDSAWKAFIGYRINENVALEGGLVSLGEYSARTSVTSFMGAPASGTLNVSVEADPGFFFSVLGILPLDRAYFYGRFGLYSIKSEGKVTATSGGAVASLDESDTSTDILFALGFGYDFSSSVGIRAEWERYSDVGVEDFGTGDVDLVSVGMVFRF